MSKKSTAAKAEPRNLGGRPPISENGEVMERVSLALPRETIDAINERIGHQKGAFSPYIRRAIDAALAPEAKERALAEAIAVAEKFGLSRSELLEMLRRK